MDENITIGQVMRGIKVIPWFPLFKPKACVFCGRDILRSWCLSFRQPVCFGWFRKRRYCCEMCAKDVGKVMRKYRRVILGRTSHERYITSVAKAMQEEDSMERVR